MQLAFPINAHQNVNQKSIGSAPSYRAQCTLSPQPIYQTLLFDFSRVWFQDYFEPTKEALGEVGLLMEEGVAEPEEFPLP